MLNSASFTDLENWIARVYQGQRVLIKPWFLNGDLLIPASSEGTTTIKVNSNADFVLTDLRAQGTANSMLADTTVQIVDNGSLERFFANPIPFCSAFGQNAGANVNLSTWLNYRRVNGNSSVNVTVRNGDGGADCSIDFALVGVLVYPYSKIS